MFGGLFILLQKCCALKEVEMWMGDGLFLDGCLCTFRWLIIMLLLWAIRFFAVYYYYADMIGAFVMTDGRRALAAGRKSVDLTDQT
jgi:hypothetical protein